MTSVAIFRYIVVCHPVFSKQPVFAKVRKYINIFITLLTMAAIITNAGYVAYHFEPYSPLKIGVCGQSFFKTDRQKALVEGVAFFFTPAAVCLVLYSFVGRKLWKTTTMQKRNRQLTALFLCSCVMWVVFWTPEKIFGFLSNDDSRFTSRGKYFYIFLRLRFTIIHFFSMIQPIILVFCYRPPFEPLQKLLRIKQNS